MRISIEYDSCWQTSVLGDDPNKPTQKVRGVINKPSTDGYMQKFVATSSTKGETPAQIGKSTVLGILCRLIGDQRKLYQAQSSSFYYFSDIEEKISFVTSDELTNQELMYLTNKSDDRCAKSTFLGVLESDNPWFFSDVAPVLWSVLFLDKPQLLEFILNNKPEYTEVDCNPKKLLARIEQISNAKADEGSVLKTKQKLLSEKISEIEKQKKAFDTILEKVKKSPPKSDAQKSKHQEKVENMIQSIDVLQGDLTQIENSPEAQAWDHRIMSVVHSLESIFPDNEYLAAGVVYPIRLYAAALYLQADRLIEGGMKLDFIRDKKGVIQIQGFSKRGFNGVRDWLNPLSGGRKKAVGSPVVVQKQSGILDITIDVDRDKAKEIKDMIDNAGVSSFYLGKKGLAYVTNIDTREVRV